MPGRFNRSGRSSNKPYGRQSRGAERSRLCHRGTLELKTRFKGDARRRQSSLEMADLINMLRGSALRPERVQAWLVSSCSVFRIYVWRLWVRGGRPWAYFHLSDNFKVGASSERNSGLDLQRLSRAKRTAETRSATLQRRECLPSGRGTLPPMGNRRPNAIK